MNKKIGILTYHKSINYGSVLQAWALQKVLQQYGYNVEIIDYEPLSYKEQYSLYAPLSNVKNLCKNILRIPINKYKKRQVQFFSQFRNNELNISKEFFTYNTFTKGIENAYDCIICGSDQIWNVHAKDCDDVFFLPNIQTKKIAYAVSINNTDFSETRCNDDMKSWIKDFQFLSCRETTGSEKIYNFIDKEKQVYSTLDPTLLHYQSDYNEIVSPRIIENQYVFLYKVWSGMDGFKMAANLGRRLKMPVYTLLLAKSVLRLVRIEKNGIKVIKKETSPKDYLSLIKYASYVMTDSFHGTAFSLVFEKPIVCVKEKRQDGSEKQDERIMCLLQFVGLEDRYIPINNINSLNLEKKIDYTTITAKRIEKAKEDINLLISAIEM